MRASALPMRAVDSEQPLGAQFRLYVGRHAMVGVLGSLDRIPEMMGDKFQQQRFGRRPGQRSSGGCHAQASR